MLLQMDPFSYYALQLITSNQTKLAGKCLLFDSRTRKSAGISATSVWPACLSRSIITGSFLWPQAGHQQSHSRAASTKTKNTSYYWTRPSGTLLTTTWKRAHDHYKWRQVVQTALPCQGRATWWWWWCVFRALRVTKDDGLRFYRLPTLAGCGTHRPWRSSVIVLVTWK